MLGLLLPCHRAWLMRPAGDRSRAQGEAVARDAGIFVKVAQRAQAERVPPALPAMLGRVVEHVAALTQGGEVSRHVVPRVVIEMRASEHDVGGVDAG